MKIVKTKNELQQLLNTYQNKTVGFVPTMGALHKGHLSLIELSKKKCSITVCSIFINPTQFNDKKDFEKYPITLNKDCWLLKKAKCDIVFIPSVDEIYPNGFYENKHYNLGKLETLLEGKFRPGHFQGVCLVVDKLLQIVNPHKLFLGRKDYQQCMVIKKMLQLTKQDKQTEIIIGKTLREKSGLAMSSRNQRLSNQAKQNATTIYKSLRMIKRNISKKEISVLQQKIKDDLIKAGFSSIDYVAIANATTLQSIKKINPQKPMVALIAAFMDGVRLIDNMQVKV